MSDNQDFADLLKKYRKRSGRNQEALAKRMGVHRNTISNLETRAKTPNKWETLQLAKEFQLEGEDRRRFLIAAGLKGKESSELLWNIPHYQNPFFTGREAIFQSLWEKLAPGRGTSTIALTQAISGLGGIGKTQVAVEYAYRYANKYDSVLWLPADSLETLISACLQLATEVLGLSEQQEAPKLVEAVKHWLQTNCRWLLILDNVEKPQEILPVLLPSKHHGSVLMTTRIRGDLGPLAQIEVLPVFSKYEGVFFLLRRAKKIKPNAHIREATRQDVRLAKALYILLGGLPLALDQAGAYIAENGCSLQQYIDLYQRYRPKLLGSRGETAGHPNVGDHPNSVLVTFRLSWEQIQERSALAGKVLQFCAFLAPDQIPEQLVLLGIADSESAINTLEMNEALGLLYSYSLIERTGQILSLHRLVQAVLKDVIDEQTKRLWAERVVRAVNETFPSIELATWPQCECYLPHVVVCADFVKQGLVAPSEEVASVLHQAGSYLVERFRPGEAQQLLVQAFFLRKQHFGLEHPVTSRTLDRLARSLETQGKYVEAEPLYQGVLSICEQQLGPMHSDTLAAVNNLSGCYHAQGKYAEAELLLRLVLFIQEQRLGTTHPDLVTNLNNLALLYYNQGKYAEAELLYKRTLSICEQQLGADHLETARCLNELGQLYETCGKYVEAEPLLKQALSVYEQLLGTDHPHVAVSLNNLAYLYQGQGKYAEAEPLFGRALFIQEQQLGPTHPDLVTSLNNLASLYLVQKRYEKAEPLLERALFIAEQQLGANHPITAISLNNLASLYSDQKRYEKAELLYERALFIQEQQLEPIHLDVATSLGNLAILYDIQGKYVQAELSLKRVLSIYEQHLGSTFPVMERCLSLLIRVSMKQGKYEAVKPLLEHMLAIAEQQLGSEHPDTQKVREWYLTLLYGQERKGKAQQAMQVLEEGVYALKTHGRQVRDKRKVKQARKQAHQQRKKNRR